MMIVILECQKIVILVVENTQNYVYRFGLGFSFDFIDCVIYVKRTSKVTYM